MSEAKKGYPLPQDEQEKLQRIKLAVQISKKRINCPNCLKEGRYRLLAKMLPNSEIETKCPRCKQLFNLTAIAAGKEGDAVLSRE